MRWNLVRLGERVTNKRRPFPIIASPAGGPTISQTAAAVITYTLPNGTLTSGITQRYAATIDYVLPDGAVYVRPWTVYIDGVDRTDLVLANTLQIRLTLSQSSTASFGLWDPAADPLAVPQVGQEVTVYRLGIRIFGGSVEQPVQSAFQAIKGHLFSGSGGASSGGVGSATGGGGSGSSGVQCTDFSNLLDRRYVGKSYQNTSNAMSSIVADIVNTYFAQDGITYDDSDGDPGLNLGPQVFFWVTGRQAFNTLSSLTGWDFNVDPYKILRFFPSGSGSGPAPFNVADNDGNTLAESLSVEYYRSQYRNRQGIRAPICRAHFGRTSFQPRSLDRFLSIRSVRTASAPTSSPSMGCSTRHRYLSTALLRS